MICNKCKKNEADEGRKRCKECNEKLNQQKKERENKRFAIGQCVRCNNKSIDGFKYCPECRDKARKAVKDKNERYKKESKCLGCGVEISGSSFCEICSEKKRQQAKNRRIKLIKSNLCSSCGKEKESNDYTLCNTCRERSNRYCREQYRFNQEMKICTCGNELFGDETICIECKVKKSERMARYYQNHKEELKEKCIENQRKLRSDRVSKGLCERCGRVNNSPFKNCALCRKKDLERKNYIQHPRIKVYIEGQCWYCGKPTVNKSKLCQEHYDRVVNTEKAIQNRKNQKAIDSARYMNFLAKKENQKTTV